MNWLRGLWHKTFSHGVHPAQGKDETRGRAIRRLPFAPRLILPLAQHIGAPAVPIVTRKQEVGRGEPIARADGFVSLPLHAPATGVIEDIELMTNARGERREAIVLRPYPGSTQELQYATPRNLEALSPQEIVKAVQDTGMAGLGGAAFPTHVKLSTRPEKLIDTLLVNGCECEPHLTTDHRVMLERGEDLMAGIRLAMRALGAHRCVIGIEDNKPDAIAAMRASVGSSETIRVRPVRTKYPQGAEKLLIKAALGREVPSGGLPADIGVAVQNVGTLAEIGYLLPRGIGLIERVITITGPGVKQPGNYIVPLGTPVGFVLDEIGHHGRVEEVILGGPMMGAAVGSLDVPVTKGVSGILVLDEPALAREARKAHPCIKCGKCVEACPMHLNPSQLGMLAAKREYAVMEERYHLNDCFECGCCTYVCPSGIPLVQHFRIAKGINRETREREAQEREAAAREAAGREQEAA